MLCASKLNENDYLSFMTDIDIYIKLATLPDDMKKEVGDFVEFLKSKTIVKEKTKIQRKAGLAKGLIQMKEGFDEPLDDFKEYM
jgi:hypothetical protein